jgi:polygalacturonase
LFLFYFHAGFWCDFNVKWLEINGGKMINIKDLGAIPDGKTNNIAIFNKAIPKDSKIVVPAGIYLTSPFRLRSGINLHLEKDAVILISDDFTQFGPVKSRWEGVECFGYSPCIYAENLRDVSITGPGTIDGNGATWNQEFKRKRQGKIMPFTYLDFDFFKLNAGIDLSDCGGGGIGSFFFRPPLIQFNNCQNVYLEGFTARNSPFWNTHILYCSDVTIKNVTFQNPSSGANGDGR